MKWEVQINGNVHDLRELTKSLLSDELRITERDGQYYLVTTRFENLVSSEEVRALASEMLPILTGTVRLSLGGRTPLRIMNVARVKDDGIREVFVVITETIHVRDSFSVEIQRSDGTVEMISPTNKVQEWVNLGLSDPKVAKALRLFGTEDYNWVNLYRLYEVIEDDVGGMDKIIKRRWVTKGAIKHFKHTANSPTATGDASRHGKESTTPPSNPMELGEARALIEMILHNWLRFKLKL